MFVFDSYGYCSARSGYGLDTINSEMGMIVGPRMCGAQLRGDWSHLVARLSDSIQFTVMASNQ